MNTISIEQFRDNLKSSVKHLNNSHTPLKVTTQTGAAVVVLNEEDWKREQETLFVLQNNQLMQQIAESLKTHTENKGYVPTTKN